MGARARGWLLVAAVSCCVTGLFTDQSGKLPNSNPRCIAGTAVVDTDADGQFELFAAGCGGSSNQLLVWSRANNSGFEDVAVNSALEDSGAPSLGAAGCDLDGDGAEELYVVSSETFGGRREAQVQITNQHHPKHHRPNQRCHPTCDATACARPLAVM